MIDSGIDADHPAVGGRVEYAAMVEDGDEIVVDTSRTRTTSGTARRAPGSSAASRRTASCTASRCSGRTDADAATSSPRACAGRSTTGWTSATSASGRRSATSSPLLHELVDEAYFAERRARDRGEQHAAAQLPVALLVGDLGRVARRARPRGLLLQPAAAGRVRCATGSTSASPGANGEWITATGNSFAAPHIAGLVARLLGKHPGLSVVHVKAILRALADNVVDRTV